MILLPWILLVVLDVVGGGRWMLFGGYVNVEGGPDTTALDSVQGVTLDNENEYDVKAGWCFQERASMPRALDGATVSSVNTWEFLSSQLGNSSFSSAHYSSSWARVLVCGGAERDYTVSGQCWWYSIPHDQWFSAPPLWKPRYGAAAVDLSGSSLGGDFSLPSSSSLLTQLCCRQTPGRPDMDDGGKGRLYHPQGIIEVQCVSVRMLGPTT